MSHASARLIPSPLVDEVDAEEMQQHRSQHEIRKRTLVRNALEIGLVLGVRLDAERDGEDKLADCCTEA